MKELTDAKVKALMLRGINAILYCVVYANNESILRQGHKAREKLIETIQDAYMALEAEEA